MAVNSRKVVIVGCGFVGSASAFALMQSKLFSEMVLIDADQNRAEGEAPSQLLLLQYCFLVSVHCHLIYAQVL